MWFSEPYECIQHLAVPGGHPSNYEPGATLLNFNDRAQTVERTPYSVGYNYVDVDVYGMYGRARTNFEVIILGAHSLYVYNKTDKRYIDVLFGK